MLVDPAGVETNIVKVDVPAKGPEAADWSAALAKENVRVSPCERYALRFVTHRHIGDGEIDEALRAFEKVRQALAPRR
jgi:threonine aldolase